jgi:hypothetical protein
MSQTKSPVSDTGEFAMFAWIVVEAAGVEPASEKARHEENYVRIRLQIFGSGFRAGESGRHLARFISAYSSGPKPLAHPAK